jgi:membrane protease YdiL (CAAX protease family)
MTNAIVALSYFALYLACLFWRLESEWLHWISLVLVPVAIVAVLQRWQPPGDRYPVLAWFGIERARLLNGLPWAVPIGILLCALQFWASRDGQLMARLVFSSRALTLLPTALGLSLVTAGFTEEFFFRGFLQTSLHRALGRAWLAIIVTSVLFGLYHLPYAYLNPRWPSHGHWPAAVSAAFGQGIPAGLILGTVFHKSRENLLASVTIHALINLFPISLAIARAKGEL